MELLAALLLSAAAQDAPTSAPAEAFRAQLRSAALPLMEQYQVPGLAAVLIHDGKMVWFEGLGFADAREQRPIEADTVFRIGSISKCFAAWGVMRLVEQGKIELDAPVDRYLSRWQIPRSRFDAEGVTVRRLLSHTAGLSLHGLTGFGRSDQLPDLVSLLRGKGTGDGPVRLIQEPGSAWKYSGGGYAVLQLLVEEVSGRPYADFISDEILDPLSMNRSGYRLNPTLEAALARPYDRRGREIDLNAHVALAAAGFLTTPQELARFAIASMPWHRAAAAESVLSKEGLLEMQRPAAHAPHWGLGYQRWHRSGTQLVGHTGGTFGWISSMMIEPRSGDALILLSNGTEADRFMDRLEDLWVRWRESLPPTPLPPPPPRGPLIAVPSGYWAGGFGLDQDDLRYWSWLSLRFDWRDGQLAAQVSTPWRGAPLDLELDGDLLRFRVEGADGELSFDGRVRPQAITGSYQYGEESGVLELVPVVASGNARLGRWNGVFQRQDGLVFAIHGEGSVRTYTEFNQGLRHRRMPPTDGQPGAVDLVAGPGYLDLQPEELRLQWQGGGALRVLDAGVSLPAERMARLDTRKIFIESKGATLVGRLWLPDGPGPHPAVVLVHGSGRNALRSSFGHWPTWLAWKGFVVLTFDKRGCGDSDGSYPGDGAGSNAVQRWHVHSEDVLAAAEALKDVAEYDGSKVGLVGFSQAGWIMPLTARNKAIGFTVTVNGGATRHSIEGAWDRIAGEKARSEAVLPIDEAYRELARRPYRDYDYRADFARQKAPGLWLYGDLDRVNPARWAAAVVREARARKQRDFTVITFPNANHALQVCRIGHVAERPLCAALVPGLFETIENWLQARDLMP